MSEYDGKQVVGIDLHRQRSVIVRQTDTGERLAAVRIVNDPVALGLQIEKAGQQPGGSTRGDVRLVLGRRRPGSGRCHGPSRTPIGCQGISVPAGEERRP